MKWFSFFNKKKSEIENLENEIRKNCELIKDFKYRSEWASIERKLYRQAVRLRELYKHKGFNQAVEKLEFQFGKDDLDAMKFGKWK